MQWTSRTAVALAILGLAACEQRPADTPRVSLRPQVLQYVPKFPTARLRDTTGAEDAERQTYITLAPYDSVVAFYRRELPRAEWVLTSDLGDSLMADLKARRSDATLWLHVEPMTPAGTEFTLVGSVSPTSAPAPPLRP